MTDPKENEEINEELSTDELRAVSGGLQGISSQEGLVSPTNRANAESLFGEASSKKSLQAEAPRSDMQFEIDRQGRLSIGKIKQ